MALSGDKGWEVWSSGSNTPRLLASEANLLQEKVDALALPSHTLLISSHWLIKADRSTLRNSLLLELERQGLVNPGHPPDSLDFQILCEEGARCLVSACLLPTPPTSIPKAKALVSTADLLPLPEDSLILWREGEDFILAASRGNRCVHLEVLPSQSPESAFPSKFLITQLVLEDAAISSGFKNITIWSPLAPGTLTAITSLTGLTTTATTRPAPRLAGNHWHIIPTVVARQQAQTARQGTFFKWVLLGAFLYAIVAVFYVEQYYALQAELTSLKKKQAATAKEAEEFRKTSARWEVLRPAFDPSEFLLEKLLAIKSSVTDENTHLTSFEITPAKVSHTHSSREHSGSPTQATIAFPTKITIRGEASTVRLAYTFLENIKKSPALGSHTWNMPDPKILPSGAAQFQVEGVPGGPAK